VATPSASARTNKIVLAPPASPAAWPSRRGAVSALVICFSPIHMVQTNIGTLLRDTRTNAFTGCAAGFVFVAVSVAAAHATMPITRGWWLVAYLILVGALSQVLLGPGLVAMAERTRSRIPSHRAMRTQLVFWNAGAITVAVADLASAPAGVLTGSLLLLIALGAFAVSLRQTRNTAQRPKPAWIRGYALLIAFLVVSTIVGAALAGALPGQ
jgi:anti-sigma factor RsiW